MKNPTTAFELKNLIEMGSRLTPNARHVTGVLARNWYAEREWVTCTIALLAEITGRSEKSVRMAIKEAVAAGEWWETRPNRRAAKNYRPNIKKLQEGLVERQGTRDAAKVVAYEARVSNKYLHEEANTSSSPSEAVKAPVSLSNSSNAQSPTERVEDAPEASQAPATLPDWAASDSTNNEPVTSSTPSRVEPPVSASNPSDAQSPLAEALDAPDARQAPETPKPDSGNHGSYEDVLNSIIATLSNGSSEEERAMALQFQNALNRRDTRIKEGLDVLIYLSGQEAPAQRLSRLIKALPAHDKVARSSLSGWLKTFADKDPASYAARTRSRYSNSNPRQESVFFEQQDYSADDYANPF